jgi:hypothetical protein
LLLSVGGGVEVAVEKEVEEEVEVEEIDDVVTGSDTGAS